MAAEAAELAKASAKITVVIGRSYTAQVRAGSAAFGRAMRCDRSTFALRGIAMQMCLWAE